MSCKSTLWFLRFTRIQKCKKKTTKLYQCQTITILNLEKNTKQLSGVVGGGGGGAFTTASNRLMVGCPPSPAPFQYMYFAIYDLRDISSWIRGEGHFTTVSQCPVVDCLPPPPPPPHTHTHTHTSSPFQYFVIYDLRDIYFSILRG